MRARVLMPGMMCALVALILCLDAPPGLSQGFGGKKGKGGLTGDPGKTFDWISRGNDHIVISEQWFGKELLEFYAKKMGITNDKLTRDQYIKFAENREQYDKEWKEAGGGTTGGFGGFGGFGGKKGAEGGKGETKGEGGKGEGKKGKKGFDPEDMFKRYDANSDGKLSEDEISKTDRFRYEWKKWDEDKDGFISVAEWKAYIDSRMQPQTEEKKDGSRTEKRTETTRTEPRPDPRPVIGGTVVIDDVDDTPPVIYRAGNLPKELPDWFTKLDTNKDGQVSLMEWMKGGKTPAEFLRYDRNDDGLITPEEVLRANGQPPPAPAPTKTATKSAPTEPDTKKKTTKKSRF